MKKFILSLLTILFVSTIGIAQIPNIEDLLDKATSLQAKGDNAGLSKILTQSTSLLEKEASGSKGDFKDKLLSSVGGLKSLIPLASKGLVKQNGLQKLISTIKLLLGANRISSMLGGGGSLLGKGASLGSSLGLMKVGLGALGGGDSSDKIGSLIGNAMGSVGKLDSGGMKAKAAEPAIKKQLGGLMDMVKGAI